MLTRWEETKGANARRYTPVEMQLGETQHGTGTTTPSTLPSCWSPMACGILLSTVGLIHSAPGTKFPTMREDLYEHTSPEWHVRRTTTGSMTTELFKDWAVGGF